MEVVNTIRQLLEIAKETKVPFKKVFLIALAYGLIDLYGNITEEVQDYNKGG